MSAQVTVPYKPQNHIRIVTAASLFDGHDAAINIMRRVMQASGAEIIHLGHNRSVAEVVDCAIQEDAQAIAMTSYQGGHVEYLKYMYDLLKEKGAGHIKIFGGGGGTILPSEIEELHAYGITRIYHPDDGRAMGLQGMINDVLQRCDFSTYRKKGANVPVLPDGEEEEQQAFDDLQALTEALPHKNPLHIGRLISIAENYPEEYLAVKSEVIRRKEAHKAPILGITGTGGAGKSSLVDELVRRFLMDFEDKTMAVISVDPSKRKTGGALLGDRIRMNAISNGRVYMRSLATRQSNLALSRYVQDAIDICQAAEYDLIIVETSGIGQSDTEITEHSDVSLYVMTSEYGAATQLEKIDMLDFADLIAINKFDKRGSLDALRDVKKQYKRNHNLWETPDEELPIYGTIASQFNDPGMNTLYKKLMDKIVEKTKAEKLRSGFEITEKMSEKIYIIPPDRVRYLAEICENSEQYERFVKEQSDLARKMYQLKGTVDLLRANIGKERVEIVEQSDELVTAVQHIQGEPEYLKDLIAQYNELEAKLDAECKQMLANWSATKARYKADKYRFQVRDKVIEQDLYYTSLSGTKVPKVALPKYQDWGDILRWLLTENAPGFFPYASGVFPLKREGEDPTRMFAGEGGPERTNKRFHYVSKGLPAKRLSTAFDSVTLYGENPDHRPDIYGKIGNSGVSVATLDDAKKLYSGFDLCNPATSVSMTINGPAPMILAFFMNAAIDQQCELYIKENGLEAEVEAKIEAIYKEKGVPRPRYNAAQLPEGNDGLGLMLLGVTGDQVLPAEVYAQLKAKALSQVRGTVQADILKEDQAQNTCIFSTEFALRMMGDIQQYFIDKKVRNFYSVSISGYHIAEAGANPITQLALTLSNGFTFVEYYLSRGMHIDDFAPNLSFFFSNGMDPEYSVLGRVARRIWAKAMRYKYKGNDRSQKLKYHIQTSGRSLHAQEIAFNDIRTTLQALYALYDNCNSLHTNAYDEAITTPTEESVRRAMAIQMIINHELGLNKNENPLQGAFIIEELTDLVEQAVLNEFKSISERGGVLGAMERMYQRNKIQEESMFYEMKKHTGELPIIGVNTFLDPQGSPTIIPAEVIRSTTEEKEYQIAARDAFHLRNQAAGEAALKKLQQTAIENGNIFDSLMECAKVCSLGQMSSALYQVGGQYRRNM
ncbi:methylmalonyl-CoA mutase family protein [Eisenibacter elegans]|uniref:methylmalonyl-CoA mutase family protein n=1 Tax=Eisenibacter elegans TaxID=997 RepID=UPI00041F4FB5|nr:methylmalonyl-CoA mutase family protein [Eisenibacter elegans]